jgi:ATP-dependent protease ClpP protease subunit
MADILIDGEIGWDVTQRSIRDQFSSIPEDKDIEIDLNTPGGSVYQGIRIANFIRDHKGKTTLTITSLAASMGSYISTRANVVRVYDDSTLMIHNPWIITSGDYRELQKDADMMKSVASMLSGAYSERSDKPKSSVRKLMDDTTWLYGQEIIDAGFADELIKSEKPESKEDAIAFAKLQFEDCMAKLIELEKKNNEFGKIAALLPQAGGDGRQRDTDPASSGNSNHEENMTFEEFIAKFPEEAKRITAWLKAEEERKDADIKSKHEQALVEARAEVETGKLTKEQVGKIMTVVTSEAYKGRNSLVNAGTRALVGERDFGYFEDMLAMADENIESRKKHRCFSKTSPKKTSAEQVEADLLKKK